MLQNTIFESKSIYVVPYLLCVSDSCENKAVWGKPWNYEANVLTGGVPLHCDAHKTDDEHIFIEKKCIICKYKYIIDTHNICKKCKLAEYSARHTQAPIIPQSIPHPNFSIHTPSLKPTRSMYSKPEPVTQLRSTKSLPNILIGSIVKPTINLKSKMETIQTKAALQIAVQAAKANHATRKAALAQYSLTDNSVSKAAAREALIMAEKEVEDACRAWCKSARP